MAFPNSPHLAAGTGSQVGIITFWTKKEHVMHHVPQELYRVCSQLYSRDEGLSALLRSLAQHKDVRDIILTGVDLNGCYPAITALWNNGVVEGIIQGAPGYIDREIPSEAIDRIRSHVTLHDLTQVKKFSEVTTYIRSLTKKDPWGEPEVFPVAIISPPEIFPAPTQHIVCSRTLLQCAAQLIHRTQRFSTLQHVLFQPRFSSDLSSLPSAQTYVNYLFSSQEETYPIAWDAVAQSIQENHNYTCTVGQTLTALSVMHSGEECFLHASFSLCSVSEIVFFTYGLFTFAQQQGRDCSISASAVLVTPDTSLKEDLATVSVSRKDLSDPASNFLIRLQNNSIVVTHLGPDGKRLEVFSHRSGEELYRKIVSECRVSQLSHAAYLGYELGKAEVALKKGELYEQDQLIQ